MALHDLFSLSRHHTKSTHPNTPPQSFHQSIRYSPPPSARPHGGATWKDTGVGDPEVGQFMAAASSDTTEVAGSDPMRQVTQLKPITLNGGLRHGGKPASAGVTPVATAI